MNQLSSEPAPASEQLSGGVPSPSTAPSWKIKLLYDGQCPLCVREVNFLKRRDAGRGLVAFVDIAEDDYTPETNGGVDFETAMGRIHALLPNGTVIRNVEVFRQVYEVLGMGWIYAVTKLPVIGFLADKLYEIWADWRLPLTGRPDLATLVFERQKRLECKAQGRCRLDDADGN
ncbi:thiol-disulfide oxidoreductase DCC family protein [Leptothermofonsia sp. ETS-13]|uniref:thiol-disulfide oxidoreductase DCC family protein n=1 Tax=Leptothermofonsia sp. ETS-13 TaxID=3035696 RepID=UPI003BA2FB42